MSGGGAPVALHKMFITVSHKHDTRTNVKDDLYIYFLILNYKSIQYLVIVCYVMK